MKCRFQIEAEIFRLVQEAKVFIILFIAVIIITITIIIVTMIITIITIIVTMITKLIQHISFFLETHLQKLHPLLQFCVSGRRSEKHKVRFISYTTTKKSYTTTKESYTTTKESYTTTENILHDH